MAVKSARTGLRPFSAKSLKLPNRQAEMRVILDQAAKEMSPHRRKLEMSRRITEKDLLFRFQRLS
jgi:hypothetical protein